MLRIRDRGLVLAVRPYAETGRIVTVFTQEHGSLAGFLPGSGRRAETHVAPADTVDVQWSAKLDTQLGRFCLERENLYRPWLESRLASLLCAALCALCYRLLPEREPAARLFASVLAFIEVLGDGDAISVEPESVRRLLRMYARWETALLAERGFALQPFASLNTASLPELSTTLSQLEHSLHLAFAELGSQFDPQTDPVCLARKRALSYGLGLAAPNSNP